MASIRPTAHLRGGASAIASTLSRVIAGPGLRRGLEVLAQLNQASGSLSGLRVAGSARARGHRVLRNGAKAVAHEATRARLSAEFIARWSIPELLEQSDHWLEQGAADPRAPTPSARGVALCRRLGDEAFARIAHALNALRDPSEAIFYTSGRTSNEAAFLYRCSRAASHQQPARLLESRSRVRAASGSLRYRVGKGRWGSPTSRWPTAIFVIGRTRLEPPRMLTALPGREAARRADRRDSTPLRERGLVRFNPPAAASGVARARQPRSRISTSRCAWAATSRCSGIARGRAREEEAGPAACSTGRSLGAYDRVRAYRRGARAALLWRRSRRRAGSRPTRCGRNGRRVHSSPRVDRVLAMGITQHEHGVRERAGDHEPLLLRGNIGVLARGRARCAGTRTCEGDRTVGITEKPSPAFLDALSREFDF